MSYKLPDDTMAHSMYLIFITMMHVENQYPIANGWR